MQIKMPEKLALGFLILMSLKLGLILFLFPELLFSEPKLPILQVVGFMAPYFIYLFLEIGMVLKWLNNN